MTCTARVERSLIVRSKKYISRAQNCTLGTLYIHTFYMNIPMIWTQVFITYIFLFPGRYMYECRLWLCSKMITFNIGWPFSRYFKYTLHIALGSMYLCMYLCMFETYLLLNGWTDLKNSFFVSSVLVRGMSKAKKIRGFFAVNYINNSSKCKYHHRAKPWNTR